MFLGVYIGFSEKQLILIELNFKKVENLLPLSEKSGLHARFVRAFYDASFMILALQACLEMRETRLI